MNDAARPAQPPTSRRRVPCWAVAAVTAAVTATAVSLVSALWPEPAESDPKKAAAVEACDVFFEHINTMTPMDGDTGYWIAGAWMESGVFELFRASLVLWDGTPDVDAAMPYIEPGCAEARS